MKIEVKRSIQRKRTVSARLTGDRIIIQIPASMSERDESHWVEEMKNRLISRKNVYEEEQQNHLQNLAVELNNRYLEGKANFSSITYSERQKSRFGSCSVRERSIRISSQLRSFPSWVLTYLVLHELAHLLHPDHSKHFWALVRQYPLTDRAKGFLTGYSYGKQAPRK